MKYTVSFLTCILFISSPVFSQTSDSFVIIKASKVYYHKEGSGRTAIVFISGLGEDHTTWQTVQDSLSKYALTISYDRSGLGKSGYKGERKTLNAMARELQLLLHSAGITGRFILVGHSLGCHIAKKYASLFPKYVSGLALIDPGYNEQKLKARLPDSIWQKREQALKMYLPEFNKAQQAELNELNANCKLADQITALPKVPIVLFTATRINPNFPGSTTELEVKEETHHLWLKYLPWATQIKVSGSRHYIQNDQPDLVVESILKMIKKISK